MRVCGLRECIQKMQTSFYYVFLAWQTFRTFVFFIGIVELPEEQFLDVFVCNITGTYNIYLRLVGDEYSVRFETGLKDMRLLS